MSIEAMKLALEALEINLVFLRNVKPFKGQEDLASDCVAMTEETIISLSQAIEQAEKQEPVAKKRVLEWVEYLKRKSDNGHYMNIPSEMSSGECWELAKELEQFINTTPQPQQVEKQEPVCDTDPRGCWSVRCQLGNKCKNTPAPQREWVEITDEQIAEAIGDSIDDVYFADFRKVIAKVKEMNT